MLTIAAGLAGGAAAQPRSRVVVAIADSVDWNDYLYARAPNLARLMHEGAVGLMNTTVSGRGGRAAEYATLGAGARATADLSADQAGWCGGSGDAELRKMGGTFQARTGVKLRPDEAGCWAVALLEAENSEQPYSATPGLLGQALRDAGKTAACIGNSDALGNPWRPAALIAMDLEGVVPLGFVGEDTTMRDPASPAGIRTDFAELAERFSYVLERADLVVVELGDTARLSQVGRWLDAQLYSQMRRAAIARADGFLGILAGSLRKDSDLLMIVTPGSVEDMAEASTGLTPLILWGGGIRSGLITSPSTRTQGLVTNTDVAPTVLEHLGVAIPSGMTGRPMQTVATATGDKMLRALRFEGQQALLDSLRMPVLHTLAYLMTAFLVLGAVTGLLGRRSPRWISLAAKGGLVVLLAAVPAILAAPLLGMQGAAGQASSMGISLAILLALAFAWRRGNVPALLWGIAGFVALADALAGQKLMRESLLGYSAAIGARFYGIGNEAGGVILAGLAAVGMAILEPRDSLARRLVVSVGLLAACVVIGYPAFGANLGMAMASVVCFAAAIYLVWPPERRRLALALAVCGAVLVVAGAISADLLRSGAAGSHIGRAFHGGPEAVWDVAVRKIGKNLLLLRHSPWTWPLVAAGSALVALVIGQPSGLAEALRRRRLLAATAKAIAIGSAAALLLNDSGVIPAALSLFFAAASVCYWVIHTRD